MKLRFVGFRFQFRIFTETCSFTEFRKLESLFHVKINPAINPQALKYHDASNFLVTYIFIATTISFEFDQLDTVDL